jgi:tetratricopeptide (TPR) repeat protein
MKRLLLTLFLAPMIAAAPLWADGCPTAPDHSDRLTALIGAAQTAQTEAEGRDLSNRMWALWADAPDEPSQAMLDRGMTRRGSYDYLGALEAFNQLVDYCPHYAEGYNQRAFVNYLRHDFSAALVDLDQAIALSPDHVAAIAGRALTLLGLNRIEEARVELGRALELNPWLSERGLAAPGGPLAPPGEDI